MTMPENNRILVDPDPSVLLGAKRGRKGFGGIAIEMMLRRDPCSYCGAPFTEYEREVDHIHARSMGGEDKWWNYTAACGPCNVLKNSGSVLMYLLVLDEVRQELGDALLPDILLCAGKRLGR